MLFRINFIPLTTVKFLITFNIFFTPKQILTMKKTILIVDDFENTLFVTGFTIEMSGYHTLKAQSGEEALSILKSGKTVDLIITDFNMPNMNGLELIDNIRQIPAYRTVPIFILSTETSEEIKQQAQKARVTLWIQKPFKTNKLVEYIKRVIG